MKIEDLKLGIKVKIPKTKLGQEEYNSAVVKMVKKISQDHLFYTGMDESSYCLSETYNGEVSGDYFYLDEIEPYFELPEGLHAKFRKATPEEIQQAQKTIVKMYSSNKGEFEIEVVDGKAWYRKEGKLLPKQFIQDIINAFGEYGGILHPYKVEVKSVNVGCMEGTRKEDWENVYKLLK